MKIRVECDVESNAMIDGPVSVTRDDRTYTLLPSSGGQVGRIQILAKVERPERFRSTMVASPNGAADWTVNMDIDQELLESLGDSLRELEGFMALLVGLTKVRWDEIKWVLLPETPSEVATVHVTAFQETRRHREPPVSLTSAGLDRLVSNIGQYPLLVAPLAFFREGQADHAQFRYIHSFFNFYYVLEGLFGGGKTKNSAVEKEFCASSIMTKAVDCALHEIQKFHPEIWRRLETHHGTTQTLDTDGAIRLLVRQRGFLHHFSNNPGRSEGSPFSHPRFEHVAELARGVAIFGLMYRVVDINRERTR